MVIVTKIILIAVNNANKMIRFEQKKVENGHFYEE